MLCIGIPSTTLIERKHGPVLGPGDDLSVRLPVSPRPYLPLLPDFGAFQVFVFSIGAQALEG
jgi:hypothetical protein